MRKGKPRGRAIALQEIAIATPGKSSGKRSFPERSVKAETPDIYVRARVIRRGWYGISEKYDFIKAHLRNKGGYLYLCWRENKRVKTFYLGKAPKASPTRSARGRPDAELQA